MKPLLGWLLLPVVVALIAAGCGQSAPRTPLHQAVQDGNYPAVRKHVAARSDLNATNKSGWTPLHLAAMNGDLPMVQLLTTSGADAWRLGAGGRTPVDMARERGQTSIVKFLQTLPKVEPVENAGSEKRGRGLIDGGLGVSDALDAQ
jgi:hypothetical protein